MKALDKGLKNQSEVGKTPKALKRDDGSAMPKKEKVKVSAKGKKFTIE